MPELGSWHGRIFFGLPPSRLLPGLPPSLARLSQLEQTGTRKSPQIRAAFQKVCTQVILHPTPRGAHLLGDAPIAMIFPVLESMMTMQKWLGHNNGRHLTAIGVSGGRG